MVALLLIPVTVWPSTYFWTQTAPGQAQLAELLVTRFDEGLLEVEGAGWGPALGDLWLRGVVVRDLTDQPALTAEAVTLEIDLAATLMTGLSVRRAIVRGFGVHLGWDERGTFNLDRRWLPPPVEPAPAPPEGPPSPVAVRGVVLDDGEVTLTWPTWGLSFEHVATAGVVTAGGLEGFGIVADLHGAAATATIDERTVRFDEHHIEGFVWEAAGFRSEGVSLASVSGARVEVSGEVDFATGLAVEVSGDVALPAAMEGTLLAPWLPDGASVERLSVRRTPLGPWTVEASEARVAMLRAGAVNVWGLRASFEGAYGSGSLLPRLALETHGATAERVALAGVFMGESLEVGALDVDVGAAVEASAEGVRLASLTLDGQTVDDLVASGTLVANLGGGAVKGTLRTSDGEITVSGPVETSVLRRRADASLTVGFDGVRRGLATWMRRLVSEEEAPQGAGPWRGQSAGRLGMSSSGRPSWAWTSHAWETP